VQGNYHPVRFNSLAARGTASQMGCTAMAAPGSKKPL